ncbi:hypothetical protein [Arcicella rosea]|uniref:DUF4374 domain-containing protein n=1 Tax=Arcicella rosea TaxID=502909 RepID=A0A841ELH4_9BACT|nr:hypothetical protein [Arcicella rosea]MBB6003786.1 hypothetical protein [Arcicella rosea]
MKKTQLLLFAALLFSISACKKDEPVTESTSLYMEEGYVVSSLSESTASRAYYVGYYSSTPEENLDLTTKSSYEYFYPRATWKNFMFGQSLKGEQTLSKIAVSKATGLLTEVASIPLLSYVWDVEIINENLGVYTTGVNHSVHLFNPTTMEKLGDIDMSKAKDFPANERNNYNTIIYRKQDNKLFLPLYTDNTKTGSFYDAQDVYVEVINLTTKQWEKTLMMEQAMYPVSRGLENSMVDETGNIYILTQGSYGLDNQLGINAAKRSRPQILKIPANNTEFDTTYKFNPVDAIGLNSLLVQLAMGTIYHENGIAFAAVSGQSNSARVLELVGKLANGTITAVEYQELSNSVFNDPDQRWVKLDLNAKTASIIQDIPLTAAYAYPFSYKYDGKFYFNVNNTSLGLNGFYAYDPATGKATKSINIAKGGMTNYFIKLSK